jgi:hypothetical protein
MGSWAMDWPQRVLIPFCSHSMYKYQHTRTCTHTHISLSLSLCVCVCVQKGIRSPCGLTLLFHFTFFTIQLVLIPMGTNCAPLLSDLFLYSYEAEFIQKLAHKKKKNIYCCGIQFDWLFLVLSPVQEFIIYNYVFVSVTIAGKGYKI